MISGDSIRFLSGAPFLYSVLAAIGLQAPIVTPFALTICDGVPVGVTVDAPDEWKAPFKMKG